MRKIGLSFLILLSGFLFAPANALALEVTYPSLFPLREGITLNQLVELIFTSSLIIGVMVAFVSLVYVGFQYIVSGDNAQARSAARHRLISVVIGIAILLSAVTLLNFLNPNFVSIPPIIADKLGIEPPKDFLPPPSDVDPDIGANYEGVLFGQNIDEINGILEELLGTDGLIATISALVEQCGPDLCIPGSVPSQELVEYDCSYESCSDDNEGNVYCETIPQTCRACVATMCTGTSCNGDPLAERTTVTQEITSAMKALDQLKSDTDRAQSARSIAGNCNGQLFSCSAAQTLQIVSSCSPSENLYCVSSGGAVTPSTIPVSDIANQELAIAESLRRIAQKINSATCANTTFTCPDAGCGEAVGQCTPSESPSGCPPELFEKTEELIGRAKAIEEHHAELTGLIQKADALHQFTMGSGGSILFQTCKETRDMLNTLRQSGRYKDGICEEGVACCPTEEVFSNTAACDPIDLFMCS